jgi:hypothetical protein
MAFTLTHRGGLALEFGDDDSYRFNDQRLLVIESADGVRTTLSPVAWLEIREARPDAPEAAGF